MILIALSKPQAGIGRMIFHSILRCCRSTHRKGKISPSPRLCAAARMGAIQSCIIKIVGTNSASTPFPRSACQFSTLPPALFHLTLPARITCAGLARLSLPSGLRAWSQALPGHCTSVRWPVPSENGTNALWSVCNIQSPLCQL